MEKIAENFEHIKKFYHCMLCPGKFNWIPEEEPESLERHYKMFHPDRKRRTEDDFKLGKRHNYSSSSR
jgi:hypothetical protein